VNCTLPVLQRQTENYFEIIDFIHSFISPLSSNINNVRAIQAGTATAEAALIADTK